MNEGVFPSAENPTVNLDDKLKYKICSFSSKNALNSQLMWGHYAGAGMGIAIEIEPDSDDRIEEVIYSQKCTTKTVPEILTNKSGEWRYECEWRYINETENQRYNPKILKVYFGTPYRRLDNYIDIKQKHKKLRNYLRYAELLQAECKGNKIDFEYYDLLPENRK